MQRLGPFKFKYIEIAVGFGTISFSNLPKLQYVCLTSHADKIVGASNNPLNLTARGIYLKNAINTLPSRVGSSSESKNWNVVWDSEVQY